MHAPHVWQGLVCRVSSLHECSASLSEPTARPQRSWTHIRCEQVAFCVGLATCKLQPQPAFSTKVCSRPSLTLQLPKVLVLSFVPRLACNELAGIDSGTACAEAVFTINQTKVSVTLTSTGLQLTKLSRGFPGFGGRHIPASGQLLTTCRWCACVLFVVETGCCSR